MPKKCFIKDCALANRQVRDKKRRTQSQQDRFTNKHYLSALSSLVELHDLSATLILDCSKDPVRMKISDVSGNYELSVSKESLSEYKMKVLLGQNKKGKPTFRIFMGDCQCYPEHPQGAPEVNQKDGTGAIVSDSIREDVGMQASANELTKANSGRNNPIDAKDNRPSSIHEIKSTGDGLETYNMNSIEIINDSRKREMNGVSYATHHVCITKKPPLSDSELVVNVRPTSSLRKVPPFQKSSADTRKRADNRSTYNSNLDGFIRFLMTDEVCESLLDKIKTPEKVFRAHKRISKPQIVSYSDGLEHRLLLSDEEMKHEREERGNIDQLTEHTDEQPKSGPGKSSENRIEVIFERNAEFKKSAFVEQLKTELEEWECKGKNAVNVEIVEDSKSASSTEESTIVTVYEEPKTSRKIDTEFDDATSNCCTEGTGEEEFNTFFLDLKEKEKTAIVQENVTVADVTSEFDVSEESNTFVHEAEEKNYEIPLETTSIDEIENLWMSFVKMFQQCSESEKWARASLHGVLEPQQDRNQASNAVDRDGKNIDEGSYPGQHSLPYFVEQSLKRASAMNVLGNNPNPLQKIKKPQDSTCSLQMSKLCPSKGDIYEGKKFFFNSKPNDDPTRLSTHKHPPAPERFSNKKSRIFFNPQIAGRGDWYNK